MDVYTPIVFAFVLGLSLFGEFADAHETLGAEYNDEEYASFMAVWRYSGHLMGIPQTILFHDAEEALKLYDVGLICEPIYQTESVVMAHSLVNSAPLIAGMAEPQAHLGAHKGRS